MKMKIKFATVYKVKYRVEIKKKYFMKKIR